MPLKTPDFWAKEGALPALLSPLAWGYGKAAAWHRQGVTPQRAGVPVICAGNLTAGGAGKTPAVLALAELLREMGKNPFALSRGYGGAQRGPLQVDTALHTAHEVGDEPLLLAAHLPTVVARDRLEGAHLAAQRGAGVIVMDDGFQNPSLHKDFSLLVVDAAYGFGNGRLLPAGPLREPVEAGLARADAVLLIGEGAFPFRGAKELLHGALLPKDAAAWRGRKVVAFAGLGRPEKFRATLQAAGCEVAAFTPFADHHAYRARELEKLRAQAAALQAPLITTEKDWMRLPEPWRARVAALPVRLEITERERLRHLLEGALAHGA